MTPNKIPFDVPDHVFNDLEQEHADVDSKNAGKRAEKIAKAYFLEQGASEVRGAAKEVGADLIVSWSEGMDELIEVKGTKASNIAWPQLVVNSQRSHDRLTLDKIKIVRVTKVYEKNVDIYELVEGKHFELERAERWQIKELKSTSTRKKRKKKAGARRSKVGKSARKYDPLHEFLLRSVSRTVRLSFRQIELIINDDLPPNSSTRRWWANLSNLDRSPQARAWTEAGFLVSDVLLDVTNGWVKFDSIDE